MHCYKKSERCYPDKYNELEHVGKWKLQYSKNQCGLVMDDLGGGNKMQAHGIRIYILDNGWLECDANWMVANTTVGTAVNPNPPSKWIKIPTYAVLIGHPQKGWILYDTGSHPDAMKGYWPAERQLLFPYYHTEQQLLVNQLASIGVVPNDIKTIVLSHGHPDHAGGLFLFKHADVYWSRADFDYAQELVHAQAGTPSIDYIKADVETPVKSIHYVTKDFELAPGVEVINLPGHTPDILGIVVHLQTGTYIFPMDAIYTARNYGPPVRLPGVVYDSLSFLDSVEKVRELAKRYNAKVMFAHDLDQFETFKLAPDFYE
ncbi:MAG: Zn-dependent hydrolase, glyoxylase [Firmicutes bacterium]|nr:Zn-dependent hydrolase, glyoxylase [Bacillota bacterium]